MRERSRNRFNENGQTEVPPPLKSLLDVAGRGLDLTAMSCSSGFLLRATYLQLSQLLRQCSDFELKPAVFELMKLIRDNPGIRQVDAARTLLVQDSNMANLAKELLRSELACRVKDTFGGRAGLSLTPKGAEKLNVATKLAEALEDDFLESLDVEERRLLLSLLQRIYTRNMERKALQDNLQNARMDAAEHRT